MVMTYNMASDGYIDGVAEARAEERATLVLHLRYLFDRVVRELVEDAKPDEARIRSIMSEALLPVVDPYTRARRRERARNGSGASTGMDTRGRR